MRPFGMYASCRQLWHKPTVVLVLCIDGSLWQPLVNDNHTIKRHLKSESDTLKFVSKFNLCFDFFFFFPQIIDYLPKITFTYDLFKGSLLPSCI